MTIGDRYRSGADTSTSWGNLEYSGWQDEQLSWKTTCYLGDWSYLDEFTLDGPDALAFLSDFAVNSFAKFDLGQAKHAVFCNANGKVIGEGVLTRLGEQRFEFNSRGPVVPWLEFQLTRGNYDAVGATDISHFKFQVSGPTALAVCEKATAQNLRGIGFMRTGSAKIGPHEVRMLRQGMAGEIGFEIHGPASAADDVKQLLLAAGQEFGIRSLGSRTVMINHLEAGFPTITHDYLPAVTEAAERDFYEWHSKLEPGYGTPDWFRGFERTLKVKGSFDSDDLSDWYRSPIELGWGKSVKFDHDFYGRAALEKEAVAPSRGRVTLVWDSNDVVDVYASLLDGGDAFDYMELPRHSWNAMYANKVMVGDRLVGVATSRGYSYYFRKMLSLCVIDLEYAAVDTEVTVVWGEPGSRQKLIRATVAKSPFKQDNRRTDLSKIEVPVAGNASL